MLYRWRWRSSIQSTNTRAGAHCSSDHQPLIAKCRFELKKIGKTIQVWPKSNPLWLYHQFSSVQSLSHVQLCDPMNRSTSGLPVHHQLAEFTQTHVHQVGDAIHPSHPLLSPSPPAPNPSQHQGLFQWVNSSHEVAKVLEFQRQHQSFQWTPRTGLL